jgi:hypothetical protein
VEFIYKGTYMCKWERIKPYHQQNACRIIKANIAERKIYRMKERKGEEEEERKDGRHNEN